MSWECHTWLYRIWSIQDSLLILYLKQCYSNLFSWQSLGREISAQLLRISQLRMEPRMLSEQFNKPVDGTTNFDSPSGIIHKSFFCQLNAITPNQSNHSRRSQRTTRNNPIKTHSSSFSPSMFVIICYFVFSISFANKFDYKFLLCTSVSLCCGHCF